MLFFVFVVGLVSFWGFFFGFVVFALSLFAVGLCLKRSLDLGLRLKNFPQGLTCFTCFTCFS